MNVECAHSHFLLSCFAEFYEAVAAYKLAIREGRLAGTLVSGDQIAPTTPADIAGRLSGKLAAIIEAQLNRVAREHPPAIVRAHRIACYAMAALADEIFVLEMEWKGRDAWLDVLLEHRLFHSRTAGFHVFTLIQQLLDVRVPDALHLDLGSVFLMVVQLGFQGRYRDERGATSLQQLRRRLAALRGKGERSKLAFPQAYQHLDGSAAPSRLAPLTPWYIGAGIFAGVYLLISTAMWLQLTQPFLDAIAGK